MPPDPAKPLTSWRRMRLAGIAAAIVTAAIVVFGVTRREAADASLRDWTEVQAVPVVAVAPPDTRGKVTTLDLPGRLEAYSQAQIFARVSGYIKSWKADIGTPVKTGQLLAEIEAPDLDQQIMQAQADLASAQANAALSSVTLQRGQTLIQSGSVSKQDLDQREADYGNKQGLVKAAQANLDRLRVLEKYKSIEAPFDGLVTARVTDIGALINAGAGGGPALFVVSDVSRLRAYVNVPQNYVPGIKIGTQAKISVPEYPGRTCPGDRRGLGSIGRRGLGDDSDAARRRQCGRRVDDRGVCQCAARAAASRGGDQCACQRADFRSKWAARGDARCRRPRCVQDRHHFA